MLRSRHGPPLPPRPARSPGGWGEVMEDMEEAGMEEQRMEEQRMGEQGMEEEEEVEGIKEDEIKNMTLWL